jgi:hypothetical protein
LLPSKPFKEYLLLLKLLVEHITLSDQMAYLYPASIEVRNHMVSGCRTSITLCYDCMLMLIKLL